MTSRVRCCAIAAVLVVANATAQNVSRQIDAIVRPLVSEHSPGFAVLVVRNGKSTFERGYGVADLRSGAPIAPATNFRLASFTKQFTAMAIMLLAHDGNLSYDDKLARFFPEIPEWGRGITVRQLLTHTAGLPDYDELYTGAAQIHDDEVIKLLELQPAAMFPAGTRWHYSNSAYVMLGVIVQKASGMSYPEFLRKRIFEPLGMKNTVAFVAGKNEIPNRAFGYRKKNDEWIDADQSPTSATLGDGGVYSSIEDLARWDRALAERTLLSAREMQAALTPVSIPGGAQNDEGKHVQYGFGWFLDPYGSRRRMYHTGTTSGFRTVIERFPDERLTIIILANRTDTNPEELALKIADLFPPAAR